MVGGSSLYVTSLPGLVAIGIVVVEVLIYHVTSSDHTFKGLCDSKVSYGSVETVAEIFYLTLQDNGIKGSGDFTEENPSLYIPILPKLVAINVVLIDT